jgi:antirestriction protein ArdC
MRAFTVFNVDQCEGITLPPRMRPVRHDVSVPQAMRDVVDGYADGPELEHRPSVRAYYQPAVDRITLPELGQFADAPAYCGTALHELIHSTGHKSRLDRFAKNGAPQHFGSERYAAEELVAEIGASMLASMRGIPVSFDQSAAYVASWLQALRDDRGLIVVAAQRAQKAVDRILTTEVAAGELEPTCGFADAA